MSEHPWLRPLPAALVMMVGGFWLSFFVRDSETSPLIVPSVVLMFAAPVYYLVYAVWLVIRRSTRRRSPDASPWWARVLPQVVFLALVAGAVALTWWAFAGIALLFGMPYEDLTPALLAPAYFAASFMGLSLLVILPLETLYSALGARKKTRVPASAAASAAEALSA